MKRTIKLEAIFFAVLIGLTAASAEPNEQEIDDFVTHYYLNPQPQRAPEVLRALLKSPQHPDSEKSDEHYRNLVALSFGLIGQEEPNIVNKYLEMFEACKHEQRLILLDIFKICHNDAVKDFFESRIRTGRFGNERNEIETLLRGSKPQSLESLSNLITTPEDLDYHWVAYFIKGDSSYIKKIIQTLGQSTSDLQKAILVKAAKWSLSANCQRHKSVLSICEEEFMKSQGLVKEALAEVISGVKKGGGKEGLDRTTILEERAKILLIKDDIALRKEVDVLFELASIYVEKGREQEAIRLYERALQADSWRLEKQLEFGKLMAKGYDKALAKEKALFVYEYAEDDTNISQARSLLFSLGGDINSLETTALKPAAEHIEIVIVPVGNVNLILLNEIRADLQNALGITYTISEVGIDLGPVDRNKSEEHINKTIEHCKSNSTPEEFREFLSELGLSESDLNNITGKIKFLRAAFLLSGMKKEDIEKFDRQMLDLDKAVQYNAERLKKELAKKFAVKNGSSIKGYLGISGSDIYAEDYNYVFGWASKGYGGMSYRRFTAEFNNDPPNRKRLLKRSLKQGISSSFFILGIKRCTSPDCARAYPENLEEHDRKEVKLCPWCQSQLDSLIKSRK